MGLKNGILISVLCAFSAVANAGETGPGVPGTPDPSNISRKKIRRGGQTRSQGADRENLQHSRQ